VKVTYRLTVSESERRALAACVEIARLALSGQLDDRGKVAERVYRKAVPPDRPDVLERVGRGLGVGQ
jgi:hypothetical protein